jgi:hypothetical protein
MKVSRRRCDKILTFEESRERAYKNFLFNPCGISIILKSFYRLHKGILFSSFIISIGFVKRIDTIVKLLVLFLKDLFRISGDKFMQKFKKDVYIYNYKERNNNNLAESQESFEYFSLSWF